MAKTATTAREVRDLFRIIGEQGRDARLLVSEINLRERVGAPLFAASMQHSGITLSAPDLTRSFTAITNGRFLIVAAGSTFEVHSFADADLSLVQSQVSAWIDVEAGIDAHRAA